MTAVAQPRRSLTRSGMACAAASTETRGGGGGAAVIGRTFPRPQEAANADTAHNASEAAFRWRAARRRRRAGVRSLSMAGNAERYYAGGSRRTSRGSPCHPLLAAGTRLHRVLRRPHDPMQAR